MHLEVTLNKKHETYQLTSFYEWLKNSGHHVKIVFGSDDLLDPAKPADLDNLPINHHHMMMCNNTVYADGKIRKELCNKETPPPRRGKP